jgi:hypothetical protein
MVNSQQWRKATTSQSSFISFVLRKKSRRPGERTLSPHAVIGFGSVVAFAGVRLLERKEGSSLLPDAAALKNLEEVPFMIVDDWVVRLVWQKQAQRYRD